MRHAYLLLFLAASASSVPAQDARAVLREALGSGRQTEAAQVLERALRAEPPCSPLCTCGCNEGLPCTCGAAVSTSVQLHYAPPVSVGSPYRVRWPAASGGVDIEASRRLGGARRGGGG